MAAIARSGVDVNAPNSLDEVTAIRPVGRVAAPIRERVANTLRRAILDFDLEPGHRLVERELIEQLGISRATLREALRDLVSEGLVTVLPQRGAVVAAPDWEEARDVYEIRAVLESLLLRRFVQRADGALIASLERAIDRLDADTSRAGDVREILAAKAQFYEVLQDGAGSPALRQLLSELNGRVQRLRATSLSAPGRPEQMVAELRAVVASVVRGDEDAAAQLSAAHVRRAAAAVGAALRHSADDERGPLRGGRGQARGLVGLMQMRGDGEGVGDDADAGATTDQG